MYMYALICVASKSDGETLKGANYIIQIKGFFNGWDRLVAKSKFHGPDGYEPLWSSQSQ